LVEKRFRFVRPVGGNLLSEFGHFEGRGGRSTLAMTALTTYAAHTQRRRKNKKCRKTSMRPPTEH